jgi:myosin heavy subunit
VAELSDQLEMAANHIGSLQAALEDADNRLATQHSTLARQDVELEELRQSLNDAEDALSNALESSSHASKVSERTILRLRQEISDLQSELGSHRAALKDALTSRELEKSTSSDVRSRLDAYLAEIDRLKVVEARLLKQVEDLKRVSAMDEVKRVELNKKVEKLEEDKELLNVALESKQTELILLQRQAGPTGNRPSSVTPRKQRLGESTTRVPQTPNAFSTPIREAKHLTTSTTVSTTKVRRESSVVGPSSIARPTLASSARTVLGASSRHNRTPERARAGVSHLGGGSGEAVTRKPAQGITVGGIKRQSSLPVLKSRMVSGTSTGISCKVTSLVEEEGEL